MWSLRKISAVTSERNLGRSLAQMLTEVSGVTMLQTERRQLNLLFMVCMGRGLDWRIRCPSVGAAVGRRPRTRGECQDANDEVHVLKGAEAVAYGSEAIAGVILLGQKSLPYGGEAVSWNPFATSYGNNVAVILACSS